MQRAGTINNLTFPAELTMNSPSNGPSAEANATAQETPKFELDFDSDEPLPLCAMRKDGASPEETCEACQ